LQGWLAEALPDEERRFDSLQTVRDALMEACEGEGFNEKKIDHGAGCCRLLEKSVLQPRWKRRTVF